MEIMRAGNGLTGNENIFCSAENKICLPFLYACSVDHLFN